MTPVWWERRGTMVYTEDYGPGTVELVAECQTVEQAQRIVDDHNACMEQ